jgi:RND family efflux transporter MFP subunit
MSKQRARWILYGVGSLAVIVVAVFAWVLHHRHVTADARERQKREHEQALGPEVPVVPAKPAAPTRAIVLPGDVRPWRAAAVYARTSGYLVELRVDRGDRVKTGEVLGIVTTPETDRQLGPLLANLATKQAIADRLRPLVPKGVVARQDLDRADADVTQARSEVDRLRALRGENVIRAPYDGIVTRRYVDVGALMPAPTGSTESAEPLVDVADTSRVRVVVYVGQRDAPGIQVGDVVEIARDADPTHPMPARVSRIPTELDLRTRTMWVEADVDNLRGELYPGGFVAVTLRVPAPAGVEIPSDAIALVAGKPSVAVVRANRVHYTAIAVADDDGRVARITRGLKPGDWIAARLSDELADNGPVRPKTPQQQQQEQQQQEQQQSSGGAQARADQPHGASQ